MTIPGIVLGIVVSTLIGTLFHLIKGGNLGRMLIDVLFSWIGFWFGHFFAIIWSWDFYPVGTLHLGTGILGGISILLIGNWLTSFKAPQK